MTFAAEGGEQFLISNSSFLIFKRSYPITRRSSNHVYTTSARKQGRLCAGRADAGRPAAGKVHRGYVPGGRPLCERDPLGFTGTYKGVPVSVQGSGMGQPSIGIYSYELFNYFDVQSIIRVGTAGGIDDSVQLRDIILGQGACTNGSFAAQYQAHASGGVSPLQRILRVVSIKNT